MYINLSVFNSSGLKDEDLIYLFSAKQIEKEKLETMSEDVYNRLQTLSLIKHINAPKKDNPLHSVRLSEKGKVLIRDLELRCENLDDLAVFKSLEDYYVRRGKEVGHPQRTLNYLTNFRLESGIERNNMAKLCIDFLSCGYVEDNSHVLEFAFCYPKKITTDSKTVAYIMKWDLFDSWFYKHYLKNKQRLDASFTEY